MGLRDLLGTAAVGLSPVLFILGAGLMVAQCTMGTAHKAPVQPINPGVAVANLADFQLKPGNRAALDIWLNYSGEGSTTVVAEVISASGANHTFKEVVSEDEGGVTVGRYVRAGSFTVEDPGPWRLKGDLGGSLDVTGGTLEVIDGAVDTFDYGLATILLGSVMISIGMSGLFKSARSLPKPNDEAPTR